MVNGKKPRMNSISNDVEVQEAMTIEFCKKIRWVNERKTNNVQRNGTAVHNVQKQGEMDVSKCCSCFITSKRSEFEFVVYSLRILMLLI